MRFLSNMRLSYLCYQVVVDENRFECESFHPSVFLEGTPSWNVLVWKLGCLMKIGKLILIDSKRN